MHFQHVNFLSVSAIFIHMNVIRVHASHLIDLLFVQVKNLTGAGGSNLLISSVSRLGAIPAVPRQHKHNLKSDGTFMSVSVWLGGWVLGLNVNTGVYSMKSRWIFQMGCEIFRFMAYNFTTLKFNI